MSAEIILVHLRRPKSSEKKKKDLRDDPFWEKGSFGVTGCHGKNLLRPDRSDGIRGKRLGFIQGGRKEMRLVFLSPPIVKVTKYWETGRSEVFWSPRKNPFKYRSAPLLTDTLGNTEGFDKLHTYISHAQPRSWCQKLSFKFRARTKILEDGLSDELTRCYEAIRRQRGANGIATHYWEALPKWGPEHEEVDRDKEYKKRKRQAQNASDSTCGRTSARAAKAKC